MVARVLAHLKTGGSHQVWVAVRAMGSFRVGQVDGINARYCRLMQRGDGYEIALLTCGEAHFPPKRNASFLPVGEAQGYPETVIG